MTTTLIRRALSCLALCVTLSSVWAFAADAPKPKLKALYVTGGGWHDYKKLESMVTKGVAKYANVDFDVKWGAEQLADPKFGEGYDVIVYNICISGELDADKTAPEVIENAIKVTRAGKPTVMLHASMHSFADVMPWTEMCGQKSREHDNFTALTPTKVDPEHPLMKTFPDEWKTKGDELYHTLDFPKESHALLKCKSAKTGQEHIVCWVHEYGKGRVFGCTLGHDKQTADNPEFQRLVANGILWACDKLGPDGQPAPGYGANK